MAVKLTRQALFDQVWDIPVLQLAKQYGISGRGLAKLCKRHDIPLPGRGYWAQKAAGKASDKPALPQQGSDAAQCVIITETIKAEKAATPLRAAISACAPVTIPVPKQIRNPHPIIRSWVVERERELRRYADERKRGDAILAGIYAATPFTPLEKRAHRILSVVFTYMEKHGYKAHAENHRLQLQYQGIQMEISLTEKIRQYRRPLTDKEKAQHWYSTSTFKQEKEATGKLIFKIKAYLERDVKQEWLEDDSASLEEFLPEIVSTLMAAGPYLLQEQRDREAADRRRRDEAALQHEAAQRRSTDIAQWAHFIQLSKRCTEVQQAQDLIRALEAQPSSSAPPEAMGGRTTAEWLAWAKQWVERYDPRNSAPSAIFAEVAKVRGEAPNRSFW